MGGGGDPLSELTETHCLAVQVRALRKESQQSHAALLHLSASFSRALQIPSPLGTFSSFPPQI